MLLGVLAAIATSLFDPSFLISQSFELKMSMCPWSHIWLTLSRLCFMFSMSKTFFADASLFPRIIVPFPRILDELLFPNVIVPSFACKVRKVFLFPVMCLEHALSMHQWLLEF